MEQLRRQLDIAQATHRRISGHAVSELSMRPSEYLQRNVRVSAFASEKPADIMGLVGPMLMFGGDFPHPEGHGSPYDDLRAKAGPPMADDMAEKFYGANLAELLTG